MANNLMKIFNKIFGKTRIFQNILRVYIKQKTRELNDTLTVINR